MMRKRTKKILKQHALEMAGVVVLFVMAVTVVFPSSVMADELSHPTAAEQRAIDLQVEEIQNGTRSFGSLPEVEDRPAPREMVVTATAYTSEVWQTDATPFVTASGTTVRHGVIAANFLPIGTKVKIPDYYGDQVFVVEDRMNPRYYYRVDIWMEDLGAARQFGVRDIQIEIYQ